MVTGFLAGLIQRRPGRPAAVETDAEKAESDDKAASSDSEDGPETDE